MSQRRRWYLPLAITALVRGASLEFLALLERPRGLRLPAVPRCLSFGCAKPRLAIFPLGVNLTGVSVDIVVVISAQGGPSVLAPAPAPALAIGGRPVLKYPAYRCALAIDAHVVLFLLIRRCVR